MPSIRAQAVFEPLRDAEESGFDGRIGVFKDLRHDYPFRTIRRRVR